MPLDTIGKIIRQKIAPQRQDHFICTIEHIDYGAKQIFVKIGASVIPAILPEDADVGTPSNKKIWEGNKVRVQELNGRLYVRDLIRDPMASIGGANAMSGSGLATPSITRIALIGTNLEMEWTPIQGAAYYEVWSNSSASPVGATMLVRIGSASLVKVLNPGVTSNLITNGGFESSNLSHWVTNSPPIAYRGTTLGGLNYSLVATNARTGAYAVTGSLTTGSMSYLLSDMFSVVTGSVYTASVWYKYIIDGMFGGTGNVTVNIAYYDANQAYLSFTEVNDTGWITGSGGYTQLSGVDTAPANARFARIEVVADVGVTSSHQFWFDDVSVTGQMPVASSMYAVVAYDGNGLSSSFSEWLQAPQQSAGIGTSLSPTSATITRQSLKVEADGIPTVQESDFGLATTGWEVIPQVAVPVYVSASSIKFVGIDLTSRFTAGVKVKFTQTTVKYFTVASSSYASSDTTVTLTSPNGSTVANAAISAFYYSYSNPQAWIWGDPSPTAPASPTINFLGIENGETVRSDKAASSSPGAAAKILQTTAAGLLTLVKLITTDDIFPRSIGKGIADRFINTSLTPDNHFTDYAASLPTTTYAWAGAPFVACAGSGSGYFGDWGYMYSTGLSDRLFWYKAITNAAASWQNKSFSARVRSGSGVLWGVRIDDGTDDNYVQFYLDCSAGNGASTLKWKTRAGGGAASVSTSAIVLPMGTYFTLRASCLYYGGAYYMYAYVFGEEGDSSYLYATGALTWMPAAGRAGLFYESSGSGNALALVDWIHNTFS